MKIRQAKKIVLNQYFALYKESTIENATNRFRRYHRIRKNITLMNNFESFLRYWPQYKFDLHEFQSLIDQISFRFRSSLGK